MASTERKAKKTAPKKLPKIFGKRSSRHGYGLSPCPFCGKVPDIVQNAVGYLRTVSLECACTARDDCYVQFTFEDEAAARAFWQKKSPPPKVPPAVRESPEPVKTQEDNEPISEPWSKRELAQKLLAFKEKRGLSFTELEKLCGISNRTLCHIGQVESSAPEKRLKLQRYIEKVEHEEIS